MICTLASGKISEKTLAISFPAKLTSTCFTWKTSRCNFCGQNKSWRACFLMHEIGRIDGGKVFQTGGNMFRIGGNKFYDRKNEIPMKISGVKRSGIGIITVFRRIPTGFPNQEQGGSHINIKHIKDDLPPSYAMDIHVYASLPGYPHTLLPSLWKIPTILGLLPDGQATG
jgi:hypothetical protein